MPLKTPLIKLVIKDAFSKRLMFIFTQRVLKS